MKYNRNEFLKLLGIGITGATAVTGSSAFASPEKSEKKSKELALGIASYTFHNFSLDETIAMTKRLGIKNIALKSMHMPLDSSPEEVRAIANKVRSAGLNLYGAGVIYMNTKEEMNNAFEYAKNAGIKIIIGVPNYDLLDLANEKVKEYDIKLAIHNHGPGDDLYSSPATAYEKVKSLDKRLGICLDVGHTQRIGEDPAALAVRLKDRLYDVHMKDVDQATGEGKSVEVGRGIIDIPKVLQALKNINYNGSVSFEHEKDNKDPLPGLAESVGYVRGIMTMI